MTHTINTRKQITALRKEMRYAGYVFRGQSKFEWELVPSIQRRKNAGIRASERLVYFHFREQFQQRGFPLYIDIEQRDVAAGQWLALMQHYGMPTRLLDWSKDLNVGLFWACFGNPKRDGSLYVLNVHKLFHGTEDAVKKIPTKIIAQKAVPFFNFSIDRYEFFLRHNTDPIVIPISPLKKNDREHIQQGVFTVSNDLNTSQDSILDQLEYLETNDFRKFLISKNMKQEILNDLEASYGLSKEYLLNPTLTMTKEIKRQYL